MRNHDIYINPMRCALVAQRDFDIKGFRKENLCGIYLGQHIGGQGELRGNHGHAPQKSVRRNALCVTMASMETRQLTSMRLTPEAKRLLSLIAAKLGVTKSAVLELAVRGMAKREGVK